jgi:hypothetical protein
MNPASQGRDESSRSSGACRSRQVARLSTLRPAGPNPAIRLTLVELLVVIALIALLAALHLPALSRADAQNLGGFTVATGLGVSATGIAVNGAPRLLRLNTAGASEARKPRWQKAALPQPGYFTRRTKCRQGGAPVYSRLSAWAGRKFDSKSALRRKFVEYPGSANSASAWFILSGAVQPQEGTKDAQSEAFASAPRLTNWVVHKVVVDVCSCAFCASSRPFHCRIQVHSA